MIGQTSALNRREYHREYYWRNAELRRRQKLDSKQRLGKAHRYLLEMRRQSSYESQEMTS